MGIKSILNRIRPEYFVLAAFAIILTAFSGGISGMGDESYSIFEVVFNHLEDIRVQTTWLDAFNAALGGWMIMLLPVAASIPVVPLYCSEIKSRSYHQHIIRIGFNRYVNSHFVAAFISGFMVVVCAMGMFAFIMCLIFPSVHDFSNYLIIGYPETDRGEMVKEVLTELLKFGIIGGLLNVFSTAFVAFTQNIYTILSLVFLINYLAGNMLTILDNYILITLIVLVYLLAYFAWYIRYRRLLL